MDALDKFKLTGKKAFVTGGGRGNILHAGAMDAMYPDKKNNQVYLDSVGQSLNYGVNELADVLHTFYLNVVNTD